MGGGEAISQKGRKSLHALSWLWPWRGFHSRDPLSFHCHAQHSLCLTDRARRCLNTGATQVAVLCNHAKLLCCLYFPFGYARMVPGKAEKLNKGQLKCYLDVREANELGFSHSESLFLPLSLSLCHLVHF